MSRITIQTGESKPVDTVKLEAIKALVQNPGYREIQSRLYKELLRITGSPLRRGQLESCENLIEIGALRGEAKIIRLALDFPRRLYSEAGGDPRSLEGLILLPEEL